MPAVYRERLIAARETLGLSRKAMARRLMTPWQTYSQWESGTRRTPGIAVIAAEQIAEIRRGARRWTPEMVAMLGTLTDGDLAAQIGVTRAAVAVQRRLRNIPALYGPRDHLRNKGPTNINWDIELARAVEENLSMADLARQLHVHNTSVRSAARGRNVILPRGKRAIRHIDWPAVLSDAIARGDTASVLAHRLGCTPSSVAWAARKAGITLRRGVGGEKADGR